MPRSHETLLLTQRQADILADWLEEMIEQAHEITVEHDEGRSEHSEGSDAFKALKTILSQIDEGNPILEAKAKVGREFDWDGFWKQVEEEGVEEDDEEPVSAIVDSVAEKESSEPFVKG